LQSTKNFIFFKVCGIGKSMITVAQIRAARGLLKWTQATLAAKAGLSLVTLNMIECETVKPRKGSLAAIQQALEAGGIEFLGIGGGGVGVRFHATAAKASSDALREAGEGGRIIPGGVTHAKNKLGT
jgi:transcriptional regulator with XRE-family HTH domain